MTHKNIQRIIDTYGHILKELHEEENEATKKVLQKF